MLDWLFDTNGFVTRSQCGDWKGELKFLYQAFNLIIWLAYTAISIILFYAIRKVKYQNSGFVNKLKSLKFTIFCFMMFIFFCGWTHLNDFVVFYWAPYRFFTLIYGLTAVFSVGTVVVLIVNLPWILQLKTFKEYKLLAEDRQAIIEKKDALEDGMRQQIATLEMKVATLSQKREEKDWYVKTTEEISSLRDLLNKGKAVLDATSDNSN